VVGNIIFDETGYTFFTYRKLMKGVHVVHLVHFQYVIAYSTESDHRFHAIPITHSIDSGQGVGA